MHGDFSRLSFDPVNHFSRVLSLQGRPLLDADANEQTAILLHHLRSLAADLIGPHGGPGDGFRVEARGTGFAVLPGRYYVEGILCENDAETLYGEQDVDYPLAREARRLQSGTVYLVYLEVWERHISALEDERIREVALGGTETSSRTRVVWQLKVTDRMPGDPPGPAIDRGLADAPTEDFADLWAQWREDWQPARRGALRATAREQPAADTEPCIISPEARFRGPENQHYRVEIHAGGAARAAGTPDADRIATWKWSRENGSVVFPVDWLEGDRAILSDLGRDRRLGLQNGDIVEYVDDIFATHNRPGPLRLVQGLNTFDRTLTLAPPPGDVTAAAPALPDEAVPARHPYLRRWDHGAQAGRAGVRMRDGAIVVVEDGDWHELEDRASVQFVAAPAGGRAHRYRTGDAWLIPARTIPGDVIWPNGPTQRLSLPPQVGRHAYAPLALVATEANGDVEVLRHYSRSINALTAERTA